MMPPRVILAVLPSLGIAALSDGQPVPAATEPTAALPPAVTFHEIASFNGRFPRREPWSPRGSILVYNDGSGLHAFDAMQASGAVRLTEQDVPWITWSPDGDWLLANQRLDGQGHERLLVIPLSGAGEVEVLRARYQLGGFLWGSNGCLYYYWDGELRRHPPPAAWCAENPSPFPVTDQYLHVAPPAGRRYAHGSTAARFRASRDHEEVTHIPAPRGERTTVWVLDEIPARGQLLLKVLPAFEPSYEWIGDVEGTVRATYPTEHAELPGGRTRFSPCSVSADGTFVVGITTVEDGHFVYEAKLHLAHIDREWVAPIEGAPDATEAHFAHEGLLLALHGLHDGMIHVGTLETTTPD
jgi:hypothetical protein